MASTERIGRREVEANDASDATIAVLEQQFAALEPLSSSERPRAMTVDTDEAVDFTELAERIRRQLL